MSSTTAVKKADPNVEIQQEDLRLNADGSYTYSDDAACKIAVRDLDSFDAYLSQQDWAARWTECDTLVQSPQTATPWGDGEGPSASVPNFLLSNTLDAIIPKIVSGLTYEDPPFLLRGFPNTTQEMIDAKTAIFAFQLQDMDFRNELFGITYDCGLRGTVICKWGWREEKHTERVFKRKGQPIQIESEVGFTATLQTEDSEAIDFEEVIYTVRRPYLEKKDLARVGADPACKDPDIRKAKWTVERTYADWTDLEKLRQVPDYSIPDKRVLIDWFFRDKQTASPDNQVMTRPEAMRAFLVHALQQNYPTSADPLRASLEIIERQDEHAIIAVLRHGSDCVLIRNSKNPYAAISKMAGGAGHQYLSSVWRPLRDSMYGQSLGQIIGSRQMVAQGTENLALEVLAYPLNPTFTRVRGWNPLPQQISLGTGDVLEVEGDDVRKGIGLLEMPRVPPEAWETLRFNKAEALESAGANQQVTMGAGAVGNSATGLRNATSASAVIGAAAGRLDGPVERIINQIFTPFLFIMDALNNQLLPTADIRKLLTDKGVSVAKFDHVQYRNTKVAFEVLAGAHLGPKREMTQFLSVIEQIAINPTLVQAAAEADMAFNFAGWFKTFSELSGFRFSQNFFVPMTPQQKKRRDQNTQAALLNAKMSAQQQLEQQRAGNKDQQIFDAALARAGEKATVLQTEHALQVGQEQFGTETVG